MSYSSVIHFSKSSNPDLFDEKGLIVNPFCFFEELKTGEKRVKTCLFFGRLFSGAFHV